MSVSFSHTHDAAHQPQSSKVKDALRCTCKLLPRCHTHTWETAKF